MTDDREDLDPVVDPADVQPPLEDEPEPPGNDPVPEEPEEKQP